MKRPLIAFAAAAVLVAACDDERPTLSAPITGDFYGFVLVPAATNFPTLSNVRFQFKRTAADAAVESLTVTLRGLDSIPGKFYTVWVGDSLGTSFRRATGGLSMVRTDTTFNEDGAAIPNPTTFDLGQTASFTGGSPREVFTLGVTRASAGLAPSDSMQVVLVTVEDSPNATTPSSRQTFWARRGDGSAVPGTGTAFRNSALRIGNFNADPLAEYRFVPTARGRGGFQGPTLLVNDSSLARPPIGYFYAWWAVKAPTATEPGDTIYLGEQRGAYPYRASSQFNADVEETDPNVLSVPPSIIAGSIRVSADTLGLPDDFPWKGFTELRLVLQPKDGVSGQMGVMRIAVGFPPGVITAGTRE
jgi:hypothetical protein